MPVPQATLSSRRSGGNGQHRKFVKVVNASSYMGSVFADFDGFEGTSETLDHDLSGLVPAGEVTSDTPME